LWPLLIAVQAIELLWVVFTYTGIEHIVISDGRIHPGFLPYSHSVGSTVALAAATWTIVRAVSGDKRMASTASQIARQPAILTTVVLVQIVLSWIVVWIFARKRSAQLADSAD
jgi:hypothetical protein